MHDLLSNYHVLYFSILFIFNSLLIEVEGVPKTNSVGSKFYGTVVLHM